MTLDTNSGKVPRELTYLDDYIREKGSHSHIGMRVDTLSSLNPTDRENFRYPFERNRDGSKVIYDRVLVFNHAHLHEIILNVPPEIFDVMLSCHEQCFDYELLNKVFGIYTNNLSTANRGANLYLGKSPLEKLNVEGVDLPLIFGLRLEKFAPDDLELLERLPPPRHQLTPIFHYPRIAYVWNSGQRTQNPKTYEMGSIH